MGRHLTRAAAGRYFAAGGTVVSGLQPAGIANSLAAGLPSLTFLNVDRILPFSSAVWTGKPFKSVARHTYCTRVVPLIVVEILYFFVECPATVSEPTTSSLAFLDGSSGVLSATESV